MKKKLFIIAVSAVLIFTACSSRDEIEKPIPPDEISEHPSSSEVSSFQKESSEEEGKPTEEKPVEKEDSSLPPDSSSQISEVQSSSSPSKAPNPVETPVLEKLTIEPSKDIYSVNEERIVFKMTNNSKKTIKIGQKFKLQKYNESQNKWEYLITSQEDKEYDLDKMTYYDPINGGSSSYGSAYIWNFLMGLEYIPGKYRMEIFDANNGESFSFDFEIGTERIFWDKSIMEMKTRYSVYSPNVKVIDFTIINHSNEEYYYGEEYGLEKYDEITKKWEIYTKYNKETYMKAFPAIGIELSLKESNYEVINLSIMYELPLEKGKYRIIKYIDNGIYGNELAAEFTVDDTLSEFDKEFIQKFRQIPGLSKVKFSVHNFYRPFDYNGLRSNEEESGVLISVFYMPSAEELEDQLKHIKNGGYTFGQYSYSTGKLTFYDEQTFDWEKTPHFFKTESELILYSGDDKQIIGGLTEVFGDELIFE